MAKVPSEDGKEEKKNRIRNKQRLTRIMKRYSAHDKEIEIYIHTHAQRYRHTHKLNTTQHNTT